MDNPDLYVPNLMSFQNDNVFLGSFHGLRFKLSPNLGENNIRCEYWYGPLCYEKSTMDGDETYELSVEGIEAMTARIRALSEQQ